MSTEPIVPHSLDDYFQTTPLGSLDKAIGNNLFGFNHRQIPAVIPSNKDLYGLTFFVKPQLNLQRDNIRNLRKFAPLLAADSLTIQNFIKCTLDPRLMTGYTVQINGRTTASSPPIKCPLVDSMNSFIPVLTNNLNSISGWPDIIAPVRDSKPGLYGEVQSMVDGVTDFRGVFDLDVTFRNTKGDVILYMFYIWLHYSSAVFEGKLVPYPDFITEREIDYNTRVYRLVLDKHREKVVKIAATGACFPISVPTGSFFDFSTEKPYNDQNKDITIRLRCNGVDYQDDILIHEFNQTVIIFNPDMDDGPRENIMIKVPKTIMELFNHRGYPRINPDTNELEWWVSRELYDRKTLSFLNTNLIQREQDDFTGD